MTTRRVAMAALLAALGTAGGCNVASPGSSRSLGEVDYPQAFAAANDVMSQYYSIASSNAATGEIESRPKSVEPKRDRRQPHANGHGHAKKDEPNQSCKNY